MCIVRMASSKNVGARRNTVGSAIWLCAFFGVSVVHAVSGFAQTNTGSDRFRSSLTVARTYVATRSASYENVELPQNFSVPSMYRSLVDSMLLRSATFGRQCARIAAADSLTVVLSAEPPPAGKRVLAWTEILRANASNDHVQAVVRIGSPGRAAELIAHELEHVIEQLDGVNLQTMSRVRSTGVRQCDCSGAGAFETERAIAVGQRVAEEMREQGP
jgi:hypothetical protein